MSESRGLAVEIGVAARAQRNLESRPRPQRFGWLLVGLGCLLLGGAACDRGGAGDGAKVASALVDESAAGQRATADEFLAQAARRRQIAAAQRAAAAKQAASEVLVTRGTAPTRNARIKTELESLAAAIERRADEAQAAAEFHLELARTMEGAADAGGRGVGR